MAYKMREVTTTVSAAIGDAFAAFEELAGEMREGADNMEGANMGHMDKCTRLAEAADELEQHDTEPDVPELVRELAVTYFEQVNKNKRRPPSRSVRLGNAQAMLVAASAALQDFADAADAAAKGNDLPPDQEENRAAVNQLISEIDEHSEFDVDFPGMFG